MAQIRLSREELVKLVHEIRNSHGKTEEEDDALLDRLALAVDHPGPSDVIFWDERFDDATDEKIVDELLNYKPNLL